MAKFKVGDKVKVIENTGYQGVLQIGDLGTVVGIADKDETLNECFYVRPDNKSEDYASGLFCVESEIELALERETKDEQESQVSQLAGVPVHVSDKLPQPVIQSLSADHFKGASVIIIPKSIGKMYTTGKNYIIEIN
jgi:hypothetical protein